MIRLGTMLFLVSLFIWPQPCQAQGGLGPDELSRQVNRGVVPPYEGAGQVERYNHNLYMVPLYLNFDSQRFYHQEYQDRLDRLAKFGDRWPSAKYGSDFQLQRVENEYDRQAQSIDEKKSHRHWTFGSGAFFGRYR